MSKDKEKDGGGRFSKNMGVFLCRGLRRHGRHFQWDQGHQA
jgi:hypothetical protein